MNSLNILSGRVSPAQTPAPSRTNSYGNILSSIPSTASRRGSRGNALNEKIQEHQSPDDIVTGKEGEAREESNILNKETQSASEVEVSRWLTLPKRIVSVLIDSIRWILTAVATPGIYLMAFLYDENGSFTPFARARTVGRGVHASQTLGFTGAEDDIAGLQRSRKPTGRRGSSIARRVWSSNSSSSGISSESESDPDQSMSEKHHSGSAGFGKQARSRVMTEEIAPARRSIRIKLHNEGSLRQRKRREAQSASSDNSAASHFPSSDISPATLKSPTSPASSLLMTKYPRAPAPPRPLIPRRQPSYSLPEAPSGRLSQKTLILDLDETLIHSMAKGGRMSTGHMVEVKLQTVVGVGGNATAGPQHPILYYVHKRPHCDDFLRRICKWYKLVVFTASVQEYADPVIDWLEQERKFFAGRYYRQHCTYRHGAFIKDLSSVEPDLSKVMILDNSPLSYMFHQDNAIPIEGWINDPTDNDLLHLVPLLEGLQYVTDVRAFLALRGGEDGRHIN